MTQKEKAKELVKKMHIESDIIYVMSKEQAKKCALIAVDEIIEAIKIADIITFMYVIDYYKEVKQEIEKL
jgi:hypothetical protein